MKKHLNGQAAILIVFVIGMVGLLIGMSLSKTGFAESIMGRGIAGSTYAFYVANSGIEDAFYKIQKYEDSDEEGIGFGYPTPVSYSLSVGEGTSKITISGERGEREITSVGTYRNYVRKIHVTAYNTTIRPEFTRIIQAGRGGIEMENNIRIVGRDKVTGIEFPVDIHSNSYILGRNNGTDGRSDCDSPTATTQIDGNAYAVTYIGALGNGSGPCIDGNAFAESINECRIYGSFYSSNEDVSQAECPHDPENWCNPEDDPDLCKAPQEIPLPDIEVEKIHQYLEDQNTLHEGDCTIGETINCYSLSDDGTPTIGDIIITGNLDTTSNSTIYLSGPVWVQGDVLLRSNQTISLDPEVVDITSLIILASGKITSNSNITFTSVDSSFLLLASEYEDYMDINTSMCDESDGNAITIDANVQGILFYAINGCALVNPVAGKEYFGAIIAQAVKLENNVHLAYDPALEDAEFILGRDGRWQISSFTEL